MTSDETRPSKTQLKREMLALQELGESLIKLPAAQLATIPLPENLLEAVMEARAMNKRGALYRQRQYIGRLMREIDAEPIRAAMQRLTDHDGVRAALVRRCETWRTRLIEEGDETLAGFLDENPDFDRQHLRRLIRDARRERETGKPRGAARALFRLLHSAWLVDTIEQ